LKIQNLRNFKNIWRDLVDGSSLARGRYLGHDETAQNSSHTSLLKSCVTWPLLYLRVHKVASALDGVNNVIGEGTFPLVNCFVVDNNELPATTNNVSFKRSFKNLIFLPFCLVLPVTLSVQFYQYRLLCPPYFCRVVTCPIQVSLGLINQRDTWR